MAPKIRKSWERTRDEIHSPEGVRDLRRAVKSGLTRFYTGIAESMWRYEFDDERFDLMRQMSRDVVPEKFLFRNGECVWFVEPLSDTIHCLPYVMDSDGINIYGNPSNWSPVPVGWDDNREMPLALRRIHDMKLDAENSVIMRNDLFGGNDLEFTDAMVSELVDNVLTLNQLQLLAKMPIVFNVTEDNLLTAKNVFLSLCEDKPVIFTNSLGDKAVPTVENLGVTIDPALFEIFDRFECMLLTYYGFPCVPITKRAQQTVSEVQSNDAKLYARRQEKLRQREQACERIMEVFGASIRVVSVIDEDISAQAEEDASGEEHQEDSDD